MTLMYELQLRIAKKIRRMALLSIIHSQGVPEDQHNLIKTIKNEEPLTLEQLAVERLLNLIACGRVDPCSFAELPSSLHALIATKITVTGIAVPAITVMLTSHRLKSLNLSCNRQNVLTPPVLSKLRCLRVLNELIIENNEFITDNSLIPIKGIGSLRNLKLSGCKQLTNQLFHYIRELKNLEHLEVANLPKVTSAGVSRLHTGADSQLRYIDLSKTSVEESEKMNVFDSLKHHTKLARLHLSGVKGLQDLSGVEMLEELRVLVICNNTLSRRALVGSVSQLKQLEHLDMDGCKIYDFDFNCLEGILALPNLRYLDCNVKPLSTGSLYRNGLHLPVIDSRKLTTLSLVQCSWLTDAMFSAICKPLPRLQQLDLSLTNVSCECITTELPSLTHLVTLGLQGFLLHEEDMLFLTSLSKLKKLNLNDTPLGDAFIADRYLDMCKHLELLSLCCTQLTDKGLSNMRMKKLKTLWIDECNVTVGAALALSTDNCPNLSYISIQNLVPRLENEDEENLAADIIELLE